MDASQQGAWGMSSIIIPTGTGHGHRKAKARQGLDSATNFWLIGPQAASTIFHWNMVHYKAEFQTIFKMRKETFGSFACGNKMKLRRSVRLQQESVIAACWTLCWWDGCWHHL